MKELGLWIMLLLILAALTPQFGEINQWVMTGLLTCSLFLIIIDIVKEK